MTDLLSFSFSGIPVAKGRPRATVRGGFASLYTDSKTRAYETAVGMIAKAAMGSRKPFEGALSVSMRFRVVPAASMSKRQRAAIIAGEEPYFGRSDLDNYYKAAADALNGVCWIDDKQIVRMFATKVASEKPGVDIRIESFGE